MVLRADVRWCAKLECAGMTSGVTGTIVIVQMLDIAS